jgi:hypothetical protein
MNNNSIETCSQREDSGHGGARTEVEMRAVMIEKIVDIDNEIYLTEYKQIVG